MGMEIIREKMALAKEKLRPSFLLAWCVSGALAVLIPLVIYSVARLSNNNQDENDNNNNDNNNNQDGNYNCSWWQWSCRRANNGDDDNNNNNNNDQDENSAPWWWLWSEEERNRDEDTNGALIFAYVWSLIVFGGIMAFGFSSYRRNADMNSVVAALVIFMQFSFISMFFLGGMEGGVQSEGKELEDNGFYGQFPVLMFMTSLFWTIFSLVFAIVVRRMARHSGVEVIEVGPSDYKIQNDDDDKEKTGVHV
jgi:phosphate/sulfate permease